MSVPEGFAEDQPRQGRRQVTVAPVGGAATDLTVARDHQRRHRHRARRDVHVNIATAARYLPADTMPADLMLFAKAQDGKEKEAYASLKAAVGGLPADRRARPGRLQGPELHDQVNQLLYMIYALLALAIIVADPGRGEHPGPVGGRADPGDRPDAGDRHLPAPAAPDDPPGVGGHRPLRRAARPRPRPRLGRHRPAGCWPPRASASCSIPWPTIITVFVGSAFVGLLAALLPAFRAGRMNVLNAIATD